MSPKALSKLPNIPLIGRVVLALAAVGMVPFLVSTYLVQSGREAVIDQVQKTHLVSVLATAERVSSYLDLMRSLGVSTLENPVLRSDPASDNARALLTGILTARPELAAAGLFVDPTDAAQQRRPLPQLVQIARRGAERRAVDEVLGDLDARAIAVVAASGRHWLRLRLSLPDSNLFLMLLAAIDPVESALRPEEVGEDVEMGLWDRGEGLLVGRFRDGDAVPETLVSLAGRAASAVDEYQLEGGTAVVSAFAQVTGSPWLVLSRQPMAVAARAAVEQRRVALRAFTLVLLLTGAIVFAAHRGIVRPIRDLIREHRNLIGSDAPTGGNEISQLREAFAYLTNNLHDREAMSKVFLGRYQVVDVLGAGAMGTVFRGWDPRLERPVALKTVRLDIMGEAGAKALAEQLEREAVTLAKLNHANIVTVFDAASDGHRGYLAMELVEGISLDRYLHQEGTLPIEQVVAVGVAIAQALGEAHRNGVVHQDIKPGNILLGKDGSIKVTDFGIAELLGRVNEANDPDSEEKRDMVCGTPGYLAPEVARGSASTPRSDLFSLGVVLYQCLAGKRPFTGKTPQDVLVATVSRNVQPLHLLRPDVPPALAKIVHELLAKDPEARLGNGQAVSKALDSSVPTNETSASSLRIATLQRVSPPRENDEATSQTAVLPGPVGSELGKPFR